jgi:hypothetical protein
MVNWARTALWEDERDRTVHRSGSTSGTIVPYLQSGLTASHVSMGIEGGRKFCRKLSDEGSAASYCCTPHAVEILLFVIQIQQSVINRNSMNVKKVKLPL